MPHMPARPVVASTTETWKKLSAVGATRPSADYMAEQVEKAGAQIGTRCKSTIMLSLQSQHMQKRKGLLPAIKNLSPDMPSPQGVYYAHTHAHAHTQTHTHTHVRAQDKPCGGEHINNECINKAVSNHTHSGLNCKDQTLPSKSPSAGLFLTCGPTSSFFFLIRLAATHAALLGRHWAILFQGGWT